MDCKDGVCKIDLSKSSTSKPKGKKAQYRPVIKWEDYYHRWNVSSETYDNHQYAVKVNVIDCDLECNCPHGRSNLRSKKKPCKHIRAVEAWLEKLPVDQRSKYL